MWYYFSMIFSNDSERALFLDLKQMISVASDSRIHKKELNALMEIEKGIDNLMLIKDDNCYKEEKKNFRSFLLTLTPILEVSINEYIRHSLLPLIDMVIVNDEEENLWEQ